ncbi:MAG: 50S ribosomal protein L10 [Kiritimatiellia bacterium]|jgi:large subunit ribosomal protein L10
MRSEKISILNEALERVKASDYCFILNYGGLKVSQFSDLRAQLRQADSRALVVKNTYLARIANELGWPDISEMLAGPTAVILGKGDVTEVAKILSEFVQKNNVASLKGGTSEEAVLTAADVDALAKLPGKDAMRAMLLAMLQAPATSLVRVLNASVCSFLYALKAYEEKLGGGKEDSAA